MSTLHRRTMLRWLGFAGAAAILPELVLAGQKSHANAITAADLPALTAQHPILLTDDEPLILDLYQMALAVNRLTTIRTCNATDALDYCRWLPVSLVISDIMKPDLSGYEMLEQLKADPATAHIPVMFASAGVGHELMVHAFTLGAAEYLTKPIKIPQFLDTTRDLLIKQGNWRMPEHFDPVLFKQATAPDPKVAEMLSMARARAARHSPGA